MKTKRQFKGQFEGKNYQSAIMLLVDSNGEKFYLSGEKIAIRENSKSNGYGYIVPFETGDFYTNFDINEKKLV